MPLEELLVGVKDTPLAVLPPRKEDLKNRYVGLRHGESEANLLGVISSDPLVGSTTHGLTSEGKAQARRAATSLLDIVGRERVNDIVFVSSRFTRARQTALETMAAVNHILAFEEAPLAAAAGDVAAGSSSSSSSSSSNIEQQLVIMDDLRERYFGTYDALPLIFYNKVHSRSCTHISYTYSLTHVHSLTHTYKTHACCCRCGHSTLLIAQTREVKWKASTKWQHASRRV